MKDTSFIHLIAKHASSGVVLDGALAEADPLKLPADLPEIAHRPIMAIRHRRISKSCVESTEIRKFVHAVLHDLK